MRSKEWAVGSLRGRTLTAQTSLPLTVAFSFDKMPVSLKLETGLASGVIVHFRSW